MRQHLRAHLPRHVPEAERDKMIEEIAGMGDRAYPFVEMHCEQARALARRLPVPQGVPNIVSLRHSRWDGAAPLHPSGDALPLNARIMEFATAMELHRRAGGLRSMTDVAKARSGGQFDPRLTKVFLSDAGEIVSGLGQFADLQLFQSLEPGETITIAPRDIRTLAEAFADFIDIKSRYSFGHSRRVAAIAYRAAVASSADESLCDAVFNAAMLHDLGKSAIPTGILDKTAPLTQLEEMRLHSYSYHTEQILAISPAFDPLREMACSVQERSDGTGYHRHIRLSEGGAALIAVANHYDELTSDLPCREAMKPDAAAEALLAEVSAGRMPREAVRLVLDSAGHRREISQAALPDGLTKREAEVLRQLAHGLSTKEIARKFSVSPKTIDNQIQSVYRKTGTRSRTTAALYAMESGIFAA
jgi:HD-GYP domain-containing protein (c-di-GMP phosphodiesterase class II)